MGLIVWARKTKRVAKIWAEQSLEIMGHLEDTIDWHENGVTIGESAINPEIPSGNSKSIKPNPPKENGG